MSKNESEPEPIDGYWLDGEWPAWTWDYFDPDNFDPDNCDQSIRQKHKYWLYDRCHAAINEYDGPAEVNLVDGYRPQGLTAPIDAPEIGGLIIEVDGKKHSFRLYRDETSRFIKIPNNPKLFTFDPVSLPIAINDLIYLTGGVPDEIVDVFEAMDLTGPWEKACEDGTHESEFINEGSPYEFLSCEHCKLPRSTLTWMGHQITDPRLANGRSPND